MQFSFDAVHDETSSGRQDKVYAQNVRPLVHSFVEGSSNTVILFGPTACGKTFTLKGQQGGDRGIAPRAVEEILGLIKSPDAEESRLNMTPNFHAQSAKVHLKMSAYMVYMDEIVDLLNRPRNLVFANDLQGREQPVIEHYLEADTNQVVSRLTNMTERLVLCTEDFYIALADAFRYRKELGTIKYQDKDLRKKSHFIISLSLVKQ